MRPDEILCLMYHELETPGQPLCQDEPGYVRYVLSEQNFREQMDWLQQEGIHGVSISDALAANEIVGRAADNNGSPRIVITFDDGCGSDLRVAAPLLEKRGFSATFYITLGFLGRRGYMLPQHVRELADLGFEIGCHSLTHSYLSDLDEAGLRHEIADAKTQLENIVGRPVDHFSCPGGRWNPRVASIAKEAGYSSVATSRIGVNGSRSDPFSLARVAVMRGTPLAAFQTLCQGNLWQLQLRDLLRSTSRRVLGNTLYDRLRQRALATPTETVPPK
jgi:peptidoglycan/xylan/chitin deacetylase (PgdA/CDA1 family)